LVRAVWFLIVGWWATGLWLTVAWLLNLTIIGLPLGLKMINYVPAVLSLKERNTEMSIAENEGNTHAVESNKEQRSLLIRGVWFLLVGWWASGIWMGIAYLLSLSIIGLPLAVVMFNKLPAVVSLYRY
jgi:uncharacterized membrane protein YccF (DUF307 family)